MNIQNKLIHNAVYWAPSSMDAYGKLTFADPVDVPCRWDDRDSVILTQDGESINSTTQVLSETDMVVRGWLLLGLVEDLPSDYDDPSLVPGAREIAKFDKTCALHDSSIAVRIAFL